MGSESIDLSGSGSDPPVEEEVLVSYSMLIMTSLLALTVCVGYIVKTYKFKHAPESLMAILAGALVGLVVRLFPNSDALRDLLSFDPNMFFYVLLPPIIFSSGYTMRRGPFFDHLGAILTLAVPGTMLAAFVSGLLVYGIALAGGAGLSIADCLVFGSLISATDPVSVLAVFHALNVDPHLFALVFGESVLNDAVAIVLFDALRPFTSFSSDESSDQGVDGGAVALAVLGALLIFAVSLVIGVASGLLSALMFKHVRLHTQPMLEASAFVLAAYTSYLFAQAVGASGIVSMLFCGIAMAHYAAPNLSPSTRTLTRGAFALLAFLAETFTFLYIGVTLAARDDYVYMPWLIVGAFFAILVSRGVCVFPLSWTINAVAGRTWRGEDPSAAIDPAEDLLISTDGKELSGGITLPRQIMLWWAGLRGAMAFALAVRLGSPLLLTTTLVIVVLTVAVLGGLTPLLLERLRVPMRPHAPPGVDELGGGDGDDGNDDYDYGASPSGKATTERWFMRVDRAYLMPFFSRARPLGAAPDDARVMMIDMTDAPRASNAAKGRRQSNGEERDEENGQWADM